MSAPDSKFDGAAWAADARPLDLTKVRTGLNTHRVGATIHYFSEIGSTNTYARARAARGAAEGEVIVAETQTAGRGRLGRRWESPPCANLYFSVILRPALAPAEAAQLTLMAAVALADAVAGFVPCAPAIKWPNDILIEGKKLAGILSEAACTAERLEYVVLGVGININYPRHLMPEELRGRATSLLEEAGCPIERESLFRRLIQHLDRCYGDLEQSGFEPMARRWQSRFALRGRRVRVDSSDPVLIGRALGVDRDGALLIEADDATVHRVIAGDVIPVEK